MKIVLLIGVLVSGIFLGKWIFCAELSGAEFIDEHRDEMHLILPPGSSKSEVIRCLGPPHNVDNDTEWAWIRKRKEFYKLNRECVLKEMFSWSPSGYKAQFDEEGKLIGLILGFGA